LSLEVAIEHEGDTATLKINGVLDISTIDIFSTQIDQLLDVSLLKIDFSNLEFIDSTGIGSIMELIYLAQEKRFKIHLKGMNETTKEIFEIVGLFTILESLQKEGI
jgi:anti-anti-sigma factor